MLDADGTCKADSGYSSPSIVTMPAQSQSEKVSPVWSRCWFGHSPPASLPHKSTKGSEHTSRLKDLGRAEAAHGLIPTDSIAAPFRRTEVRRLSLRRNRILEVESRAQRTTNDVTELMPSHNHCFHRPDDVSQKLQRFGSQITPPRPSPRNHVGRDEQAFSKWTESVGDSE